MSAPALTVYVQGQGAITADGANAFEQTCDTVSELRSFPGVTGMQVFSRGLNAFNDGGGGEFAWDQSLASPVDNGYSVIVPTGSIQGAWVRIVSTPSTTPVTWYTQTQWEATVVPAGIAFVVLDGVLTPGDAPPRPMFRLASTPSPLQSWYVQSADGSFWQDSGPDFYPEWVGAQAGNTAFDNAPAMTQAWLAHLNLGLTLRILARTYYFLSNLTWDISGFRATGFQVFGSGKGLSQFIWQNVTTPAGVPQFLLYNSGTGGVFWSNLVGLDFTTNVNGTGVALNVFNVHAAFNNCNVDIRSSNKNTGSGNIGLSLDSWYSSHIDIRAGGSGAGQGYGGMLMNDVHFCTGILNVGACSTCLVTANGVAQNAFTVDFEDCAFNYVSADPTCEDNYIVSGVMNCLPGLGTNFSIDNTGGGALRIGAGVTISGNFTSFFANPAAQDATWGGQGVKLDQRQTDPAYAQPTLTSGVWILNAWGHNVNIWFRGSGAITSIFVRNSGDFSSGGATALTNCPATGVAFRLQYAQSINVTFTGTVAWSWNQELQ